MHSVRCIFSSNLPDLSPWTQDMSIELSLEDVKKVAYHYGFVMEVRVLCVNLYWFFYDKYCSHGCYFGIWFAGGENDRNYIHCKSEINDAGNLLIFPLFFFGGGGGGGGVNSGLHAMILLCFHFNLISHNQLLEWVSFDDWSVLIYIISSWSWCIWVNLTFQKLSVRKNWG